MLKVMLNEREIKEIVNRIANQLTEIFKDDAIPPVIICILKGASLFMSDLIKEISIPVEIDFVQYSSYSKTSSTGIVFLKKDFDVDIKDRNVVVVEDIIDTGRTLKKFNEYLETFSPKKIYNVVLLDKPSRREVNFNPDFVGKEIEDYFVIGYGLDYCEYYRNTKEIYAVDGDEDFLKRFENISKRR